MAGRKPDYEACIVGITILVLAIIFVTLCRMDVRQESL